MFASNLQGISELNSVQFSIQTPYETLKVVDENFDKIIRKLPAKFQL